MQSLEVFKELDFIQITMGGKNEKKELDSVDTNSIFVELAVIGNGSRHDGFDFGNRR